MLTYQDIGIVLAQAIAANQPPTEEEPPAEEPVP
jgi:hypothetical protein